MRDEELPPLASVSPSPSPPPEPMAAGPSGVQVLGDRHRVLSEASAGLVVPDGGRLVALVGVEDLVVVDTPDALLVTTRDRAQDVKSLVDRLRESGRGDVL